MTATTAPSVYRRYRWILDPYATPKTLWVIVRDFFQNYQRVIQTVMILNYYLFSTLDLGL